MSTAVGDWAALQATIAGEVVLPGSATYEDVRKPAIPRFHAARPAAVVRCAAAADIAAALALARRTGLEVAIRSGGHDFAGRSSTEGVVIDVRPLRSVSLEGEVATIGAGARLGEVYDALDAYGLTIPAGCGPDVGIAGLVLGGGLGIMGRVHGLTCDSLLAAEVALADGTTVQCDEERDADLFWALRGAGNGSLGVATSLSFRTVPAPQATAFEVTWPQAAAAALIEAWQDWAPDGPDELAASLLVSTGPDPTEPADVRVIGAMLGGASDDTARLIETLGHRAGAEPVAARMQTGGYREAKRFLSGLGGGEESPAGLLFSRSEFFAGPLPAPAIAGLVDRLQSARMAGEARELDFSPWGGAYNRVAPGATAFVHRGPRFLLKHATVVDEEDGAPAAREWLDGSWEWLRRWGTGGVYPNFPDPALQDPGRAYYGANLDRLLRVKAAYDPEGVFRFA